MKISNFIIVKKRSNYKIEHITTKFAVIDVSRLLYGTYQRRIFAGSYGDWYWSDTGEALSTKQIEVVNNLQRAYIAEKEYMEMP